MSAELMLSSEIMESKGKWIFYPVITSKFFSKKPTAILMPPKSVCKHPILHALIRAGCLKIFIGGGHLGGPVG